MGGGMGGKGHGQNKPPKDGVGKVCPVCGAYNKKDATLCGDNKPNAGCGAALPATLTRFPSYAPGKGQPTVAPVNNAPQVTTKNSPIHPYGGKIDVKASTNRFNDNDYWRNLNISQHAAREEFKAKNPNLTAEQKGIIERGHGNYIGSCGHRVSGCRCAGGIYHPTFQMQTPCSECQNAAPQPDSMALLKQKIKKKDDINMTWAGLAPD